MKIYKTEPKSRLKWLVALVLFAMAMTFTTAEVYGFPNSWRSNNNGNQNNGGKNRREHDRNNPNGGDNDTPSQVPEPTTLILLGSGLVAAYVVKKCANKA